MSNQKEIVEKLLEAANEIERCRNGKVEYIQIPIEKIESIAISCGISVKEAINKISEYYKSKIIRDDL